MEKLLKDVHFETVENSYSFRQDLFNMLNVEKDEELTKILDLIANFVNQNYTPKK